MTARISGPISTRASSHSHHCLRLMPAILSGPSVGRKGSVRGQLPKMPISGRDKIPRRNFIANARLLSPYNLTAMDKLLALISEIGEDDDDDTVIRFGSVTPSGSGLELRLEVSTLNLEANTRTLEILCEDVLEYAIKNEAASSLVLTSDHPLLWRFTHDSASAFFYGIPTNAHAATGALYEAHRQAVDDWFGLESQLNGGMELSKLLSAGNSLLANGPLPLLAVYKNVLSQYGVEVEICNPYPPGGRMSPPNVQNRLRNETKALLIGDSHITGIGWTAQ